MILVVAMLFLCCAVLTTRYYCLRAAEDREPFTQPRWLNLWMLKGLGVPLLLWMVFNSGILPGLPTLLPHGEAARAADKASALVTGTAGAGFGRYGRPIKVNHLLRTR